VLLRTHWEPGEHHWKRKVAEQHGRMMKNTNIFKLKKIHPHITPLPKGKKKKKR
jgi:hypothetical protein